MVHMLPFVLPDLVPNFDMGGARYTSIVGSAMRISPSKGLVNHNVLKQCMGSDQWRRVLPYKKKSRSSRPRPV